MFRATITHMSLKSKIYTKTGDKGTTRLVDGQSVNKFSPRVEAYGTVDELNSFLGEARARVRNQANVSVLDPELEKIQNILFSLGSLLACDDKSLILQLPPVTPAHISWIESQIDRFDESLEPLKNFILPAGHEIATSLHVARTVCRRAERLVSALPDCQNEPTVFCLIFLNRLSDLFFVLARWSNKQMLNTDVIWKKV
jgi:cob(I)alamin adenosyltransferase